MKTTFCEGNFGSTNWRTSLEKYTQSKIRDKGLIDIQPLNRATIAQQRVRMEGWRQRWLGPMGTIWKKKKERKKEGTNERKGLTLTGLLMEGMWITSERAVVLALFGCSAPR
jgi:hypothetical protein